MRSEGRTCIVLGGRGFVGSAIVEEARARGCAVTLVEKDDYDTHIGASADLLVNANGNSKKYLAAQNPELEHELSVRSVEKSLQDFRAGRYVHLSSIDVYPDVRNPAHNRETAAIDPSKLSVYGLHKHEAEERVRAQAKSWLMIRMGGFVGPGLWKNSIHDLLKRQSLRVHPDSEYQYLHTRDLARIVFDLVEAGVEKEIFNVAGDGVISPRAVAAMIPGCDLSGLPPGLPRERYEINVDKIRARAALPRTVETVREFVQNVLSGKEAIR